MPKNLNLPFRTAKISPTTSPARNQAIFGVMLSDLSGMKPSKRSLDNLRDGRLVHWCLFTLTVEQSRFLPAFVESTRPFLNIPECDYSRKTSEMALMTSSMQFTPSKTMKLATQFRLRTPRRFCWTFPTKLKVLLTVVTSLKTTVTPIPTQSTTKTKSKSPARTGHSIKSSCQKETTMNRCRNRD